MAELRNYVTGFLLVGCFAMAMIMFAVGIASENNSPNSIMDDSRISNATVSLNSTLNAAQDTANNIKASFENDNPILGFGSLILYSIIGAGRLLFGTIINMFMVLSTLLFDIIGINPIVFTVISAALIISMVLLGWRLYRLGQ